MREETADLSVILPAYNEQSSISAVLNGLEESLSEIDHEIVVVDDGSTDNTSAVIRNIAATGRIQLVRHPQNLGVGKAFADGIAASSGTWVALMDADGQMDPDDLCVAYQLRKENIAVLGYRRERADGLIRKAASACWNAVNRFFFDFETHIRDIDCGLKLIPGEIARSIRFTSNGAGFFPELLLSLQTLGIRFQQFPVHHYPRAGGQATGIKPKVALRAFSELFALLSRYDGNTASLLLEFRIENLLNTETVADGR